MPCKAGIDLLYPDNQKEESLAKVKQEYANEDGWSDWIRPINNKFRMICCDCGFAHDLEFDTDTDGHIMFRASRNNRSTAQIRRHLSAEGKD
jgi:hypothetical protein